MARPARPFLIATFGDEAALVRAVRVLRGQGFRIWDVYAPYPVHGLPEALGVRPSRLPLVAGGAGALGLAAALALQYYASVVSWPLDVGGKPHASWLAFVPVAFELTVLAAATATVAALLFRCRLYPGAQPGLVDAGVTEDVFALALRRRDGGFDAGIARRLLEENGARVVEERRVET